jgi:hypothetical protein
MDRRSYGYTISNDEITYIGRTWVLFVLPVFSTVEDDGKKISGAAQFELIISLCITDRVLTITKH